MLYVGKGLALKSDRHDLKSSSSCVTLSKSLRFSEPLIFHLEEEILEPNLKGCRED